MKDDDFFIARKCIYCGNSISKRPALISLFLAHRMFGWSPVNVPNGMFNDIPSGVSYPTCNSCECNSCNGLFMDIRPDRDSSKEYYHEYQSEAFFKERELLEPSFATRRSMMHGDDFAGFCSYLSDIESYILNWLPAVPQRVLDWGGGDGTGTPFNSTASEIYLTDINSTALNSRDQKVKLHNPSQSFDYNLIVCRHVLEHVPYPRVTISDIVACGARDTLYYFEVPLEAEARLEVRARPQLKIWTEHINIFTIDSLIEAVNSSGLTVVNADIFSTNQPYAGKNLDFKVIRLIAKL